MKLGFLKSKKMLFVLGTASVISVAAIVPAVVLTSNNNSHEQSNVLQNSVVENEIMQKEENPLLLEFLAAGLILYMISRYI